MKHMLNLPRKVYFKAGSLRVALRELSEVYGYRRAYIVTETDLFRNGTAAAVIDLLHKQGLRTAEFYSLQDCATVSAVESALPELRLFEPDVILGVGGEAAMNAAKALWLLYTNPSVSVREAAAEPTLVAADSKVKLVLAATDFRTGAQNTPFAVLRDASDAKIVVKSFSLLPEISVTDADLTAGLSPEQVRDGAAELSARISKALSSPKCDEFTHGLLTEAETAIRLCADAAQTGNPVARERLHNAASVAGAAFGNILDADEL